MKKKLLGIMCAVALLMSLPFSAFAASSAFDEGSETTLSFSDEVTGNVFMVDKSASHSEIASDWYWVGSELSSEDMKIGTSGKGSALFAGQTIALSKSEIADSLRAAGSELTFSSVKVGNNITAAGRSISLEESTSANGVYLAGETISISGSYGAGSVMGSSVYINAVIEGNLEVSAGKVELGPHADIKGTLSVPASAEYSADDAAQVAHIEQTSEDVSANSTEGTPLTVFIIQVVFALMAHIVLVGFFFFIMRNTLLDATNLTKERLAPILLTGCVMFFAAPLVMIALLFPLVTIPIVVFMALAMIAIWLFSIPFAGSVLGMRVFSKMKQVPAAILGTVILTLICYVAPYMSIAVPTFCTIITAGYFGQKFLIRRRSAKAAAQPSNAGTIS